MRNTAALTTFKSFARPPPSAYLANEIITIIDCFVTHTGSWRELSLTNYLEPRLELVAVPIRVLAFDAVDVIAF